MIDNSSVQKFKEFCLAEYAQTDVNNKFDRHEEQDWYSLSLGFFAALGHNAYDAHAMALEVRYTKEYWSE